MPRKYKKDNSSSEGIVVGDISGGTGFAIGTGAYAVVTQNTGLDADQIAKAFKSIEQALTAMPEGRQKESVKKAVKNLKAEARKGDRADESKAQQWINFLAETAPDVWDVAMATFANPIQGVGTVFKKIAEKAMTKQKKKVRAR